MAEAKITDLPFKIQNKIEEDSKSGCWLWMGGKSKGYGGIYWERKHQRAHRVVYRILIGEIPEGLELDHLCRVRNCVNPKHLEPVTGTENIARGMWNPIVNAKLTHCAVGHKFNAENTYRVRGERVCRECRRVSVRKYRKRLQEKKVCLARSLFRV